jgi:hypothetical protein
LPKKWAAPSARPRLQSSSLPRFSIARIVKGNAERERLVGWSALIRDDQARRLL